MARTRFALHVEMGSRPFGREAFRPSRVFERYLDARRRSPYRLHRSGSALLLPLGRQQHGSRASIGGQLGSDHAGIGVRIRPVRPFVNARAPRTAPRCFLVSHSLVRKGESKQADSLAAGAAGGTAIPGCSAEQCESADVVGIYVLLISRLVSASCGAVLEADVGGCGL